MLSPRTLLFSEKNNLTNKIAELLTEKGCVVSFSDEDIKKGQTINGKKIDYLIYLSVLNFDFEKDLESIRRVTFGNTTKILFIFPYAQQSKTYFTNLPLTNEILSDNKLIAGAIYLGDILDESGGEMEKNLCELLRCYFSNKVNVFPFSRTHIFYPLSIQYASERILRSLFSLKAYSKKTAILGEPININELLKLLKTKNLRKDMIFKEEDLVNSEVDERIYVRESKRRLLNHVLDLADLKSKFRSDIVSYASKNREENTISLDTNTKYDSLGGKIKKSLFYRWKLKLLFILSTIVLIPFIFLTVSTSLLFVAYKSFPKGYFGVTNKALSAASFFSRSASNYSLGFMELPILKNVYSVVQKSAHLIQKETAIGEKFINVSQDTIALVEKVTNDETYDVSLYGRNVSLELDLIYKELAFLESEIHDSDPYTRRLATLIVGDKNLKELREKTLLVSKVIYSLGGLLGKGKPSRYVLVLENTVFARATGGLIESLVFVTLSNGKITDLEVTSAADADKNLEGAVDAPLPLQKYFDRNIWYLKDANWDPDFPTTANQIMWFLDKELNEKVDGIIAFDSNVFSDILTLLGRTSKDTFNQVLRADKKKSNYPEETESTVSGFLETFVHEPKVLTDRQKFKLGKVLFSGLENRNIQIYLTNTDLARQLNDLDWDGSLIYESCLESCYSDFVSVSESTHEGDSTLIKREYKYTILPEEGLIKRNLFIFLENVSDEKYSYYMRVFVNGDSGFSPIEIISNESEESKFPETRGLRGLKEAGVFDEIYPHKSKSLLFSWEGDSKVSFKKDGEYKLMIRKQAGMENYPLGVNIKFPHSLSFLSTQPFTLTSRGGLIYNTKLSDDFSATVRWSKND